MKEEWKDIKGFNGQYQVSNLGRVRSRSNNYKSVDGWIYLKTQIKPDGYCQTVLSKNKKTFRLYIHRLVAEYFVDNPNNYKEVNHIDENPQNNAASNLEYCTHRYNINYGTLIERRTKTNIERGNYERRKKPVSQYTLDGEFVRTYNRMNDVEEYGFDKTSVCHCCHNKYNKCKNIHKGFIFQYASAPPPPKATYEQLSIKNKPIIQYTLEGNVVREYKNLKEAEKYGFGTSSVNECCHNKYLKTKNIYKNYIWQFATSPPPPKKTFENYKLF